MNREKKRRVSKRKLREVALMAHAARALHDSKLYGLLEGGPDVNVERCDALIARATAAGISFKPSEITRAAVELVASYNSEIAARPKPPDDTFAR
jgi:hypothetical protein